MAELLSIDKLLLFIVFFVPGLVSLKVWRLLIPSEKLKVSEQVIEIVAFGCINFALLFWLVDIGLRSTTPPWALYLSFLCIFFIFPVVWPVILSSILKSGLLRGRVVHPTPRSWDYFFSQGEVCYVLVHLKGGRVIDGYYGPNSFASSFPQEHDIYLEEVWKLNKKGEFLCKIEETKGVLLSSDYIEYIEFFRTLDDTGGNNHG